MRKRWYLAIAVLAIGCTTCPQADFMDFTFKSRDACCPPNQPQAGVVVAPQPYAPAGTVMAVPAQPQAAPAPPPEEKKQGHPWLHPFRRNRN